MEEPDPNLFPATRREQYLTKLHCGERSPYDFVTKFRGGGERKIPDIQFFFCAKHENRGKIESHLWFFLGFCAHIKPDYCQMIDVGTIPKRESISSIIFYMDTFKQVGGVSTNYQFICNISYIFIYRHVER